MSVCRANDRTKEKLSPVLGQLPWKARFEKSPDDWARLLSTRTSTTETHSILIESAAEVLLHGGARMAPEMQLAAAVQVMPDKEKEKQAKEQAEFRHETYRKLSVTFPAPDVNNRMETIAVFAELLVPPLPAPTVRSASKTTATTRKILRPRALWRYLPGLQPSMRVIEEQLALVAVSMFRAIDCALEMSCGAAAIDAASQIACTAQNHMPERQLLTNAVVDGFKELGKVSRSSDQYPFDFQTKNWANFVRELDQEVPESKFIQDLRQGQGRGAVANALRHWRTQIPVLARRENEDFDTWFARIPLAVRELYQEWVLFSEKHVVPYKDNSLSKALEKTAESAQGLARTSSAATSAEPCGYGRIVEVVQAMSKSINELRILTRTQTGALEKWLREADVASQRIVALELPKLDRALALYIFSPPSTAPQTIVDYIIAHVDGIRADWQRQIGGIPVGTEAERTANLLALEERGYARILREFLAWISTNWTAFELAALYVRDAINRTVNDSSFPQPATSSDPLRDLFDDSDITRTYERALGASANALITLMRVIHASSIVNPKKATSKDFEETKNRLDDWAAEYAIRGDILLLITDMNGKGAAFLTTVKVSLQDENLKYNNPNLATETAKKLEGAVELLRDFLLLLTADPGQRSYLTQGLEQLWSVHAALLQQRQQAARLALLTPAQQEALQAPPDLRELIIDAIRRAPQPANISPEDALLYIELDDSLFVEQPPAAAPMQLS